MAFKKKAVVEATRTQEVVAEVAKLTPDAAAKRLSNTQLEIQSQLSKLHGQYLGEFSEFEKLRAAKDAKAAELQNLHEIEVTAGTLEDLRTKIDQQRDEWTKELASRTQDREREEEEFTYNLALKRKKEQQQYQDALTARDKVHADKLANLVAREANLKDLETKVAGHEAAIDAAAKKAEAIVGSSLKKHYENEARISSLTSDANHRAVQAQLLASAQFLEHVKQENADLKARHAQALADVKELSSKVTDAMASRETVINLQKAIETLQPVRGGK